MATLVNFSLKSDAGSLKGTARHGHAYLAAILGNAAVGAAKTDTVLGERYRAGTLSVGSRPGYSLQG